MRMSIVAALAALTAGVAAAAPAAWQPVETTHIGAYTLTVESDAGADDSPRLEIAAPGGHTTTLSLSGGLATVKDAMPTKSLAALNKLHSKYLYATDALRDRASGDRLVVVFGAAQDPDPYAIRVLHLAANGQVQTLLSDDAFELTAIADLNKDGVPELIGRPSWSQMDTKCLSTYDPIGVYRLSGAQYVYDEGLSKTYNLTHRYVWAGPKSREDVAVDICRKAGPKLVPAPTGPADGPGA
ncbi:MAG TPA: hypothetical protein VN806_00020 [Caulobacteraceae bacterium]|nr:hypothetical protein [Caulobacteraceae bacterium]